MIWQQPWAWIGAVTVAIPIVIHLLGRRRPKPLPFPTLRFLQASKVAPARRHRLNDLPLLLVRAGILLVAAAALAQPWWPGAHPPVATGTPARAIVVDTSASMMRKTPDGRAAMDVARAQARAIVHPGDRTGIIETATPGAALAGAARWLAAQQGPREIIVISDLQSGAIAASDVATVPAEIGLRFDAVEMAPAATPAAGPAMRLTAGTFAPALTLTPDLTTVAWTPAPDGAALIVHAPAADRGVVDAAMKAADAEGLPVGVSASRIDLFLPGAPDATAMTQVRLPAAPWMFDVIDRVRQDMTLASLAASIADRQFAIGPTAPDASTSIAVVRAASGRPVLLAQNNGSTGDGGLAFVSTVEVDDVFTPAVILAIGRAMVPASAWTELESARIPDSDLRGWTRPPSSTPAPPVSDTGAGSDGRWLWVVVLGLLGVEQWMRRGPAASAEVARAGVA